MSCAETPVTFTCQGEQLVGMLAEPAAGSRRSGLGVLIVVGGPQYRVGSHRQFVQLARRLTDEGHVALRFDVRGMGDSSGAQRAFTDLDDDIDAALLALTTTVNGLRSIVLWGLCDGASASLLYLSSRNENRVAGVCLLNPWVRSAQSLARTHVQHYYLRRITDASFWRKVLGGGIGLRALAELVSNIRTARGRAASTPDAPFQARMAAGLERFGGPVLVLLSENDHTAQEFKLYVETDALWRRACAKLDFRQQDLAEADHTLSAAAARKSAEATMLAWLRELQPMTSTR